MNLPSNYDAWRLSTPEDYRRACPDCDDTHEKTCPECGDPPDDMNACPERDGTGIVPCDCGETDELDRADYELERARDREMED